MKWYISTLLAIVTMVLGYFYFVSNRKVKDPTFIVDKSARQQIISQDAVGSAPLRITKPDGGEIKGSVYSETFYFFNQGNDAIKSEHVLEPISFYLSDTTSEIIECKLLKVTRSVTALKLIGDSVHRNRITVDFRILEEDDGLMGQIIYASTSNPSLQIAGAIEGAPRGFSDHYKSDLGWLSKIKLSSIFSLLVVVVTLSGLYFTMKSGLTPREVEAEPAQAKTNTLKSALITRYQVIIRNVNNFNEKTSFVFRYSQLILASTALFLTVFVMSTVLVATVEGWVGPAHQERPPVIDLPESLS